MQLLEPSEYRHVNYLWDDDYAAGLDAVERLVYRSNLLGADQRITNTGGGNTSSKIWQVDPLSGADVDVMFVKGSGGDLRTAKRENFASLYMDKLMQLRTVYEAAEVKGVKTPIEDAMVGMYPHCVFNLNPRASSIDTPLHAFIPFRHVDHTHPNAVIAIAASSNGRALTQEIYGDDVVWLDWQRPGFDLGLVLAETIAANPGCVGIVLGGHGLINWADDDKTCYDLSLTLIEKAARYLAERDLGASSFGGAKYGDLEPRRARRCWSKCCRGCVAWCRVSIASSPPLSMMTTFSNSSIVSTRRGWLNWAHPAPITFCAPRSSRSTSTGIRRRKMPLPCSRNCAAA